MIFIASLGQIRWESLWLWYRALYEWIPSGGHFNPAVTLGIFIAGGIEMKKALVYALMQLIGGMMGAGIFRVWTVEDCLRVFILFISFCHIRIPINRVMGVRLFLSRWKAPLNWDNWQVIESSGGKVRKWELFQSEWSFRELGLTVELLLTFAFVTIILMVTMTKQSNNSLAPIYIGGTLAVCIFASYVQCSIFFYVWKFNSLR